MEHRPRITPGKTEIIIVSGDIALNASLQRLISDYNYPGRGFFDLDAAINWHKMQQSGDVIFVLIPPFIHFSQNEAIQALYEINPETHCIILEDADNFEKTKALCPEYPFLEVLVNEDKTREMMLPALIRQIILKRDAEKELAVHLSRLKSGNYPAAPISDEVTANSKKRITQREMLQKMKADHATKNMVDASFLKQMSLEIRNPASAVIGMARTLEKTKLDKEQKSCLNSIIISASNLLAVMSDVLIYANVSSSKQELVYHNFDLREMVDEVIALYKQSAQKKNITLQAVVHQSVPEIISADKIKLQQVLNNILDNAVKYTNVGSVKVFVETASGKSGRESLHFSVRDTGVGVHKKDIPYVFDSFFKKHQPEKGGFGGSGMGLSIVKGLVELMEGETGFESEHGKGTKVFFSIPLLTRDYSVAEDNETFYSTSQRDLNILLAEDDAINQMYLAGFLRSQGWKVDTVFNGIDALELLAARNYDLVILDGQMPKMDGFETAEKIRQTGEDRNGVPILAISGYANPEDRERFLQSGMDAYLSKPVDEQELLRLIHKLVK